MNTHIFCCHHHKRGNFLAVLKNSLLFSWDENLILIKLFPAYLNECIMVDIEEGYEPIFHYWLGMYAEKYPAETLIINDESMFKTLLRGGC